MEEGRQRKETQPGQFGARLEDKREAALGIGGQVTEGLCVWY